MADHDLVIRGATVIDGTGRAGQEADVACRDGVISAIGDAGSATEEIDGRGLCLAPGFIDPHTHLDANLFWDPDLTPSSGYGVTTVVTGNCGYTLAPVDDVTRDYVIDVMSVVEAIPRDALVRGVPWDWSTLGEYFAKLTHVGALTNFATYAGHVAIRAAVMGAVGARERVATPDEIAQIAALVLHALELGAVGFSTDQVTDNVGPSGTRLPGQVCGDDELLAIAAVLGRGRGSGVFAMAPAALLASERAVREQDLEWHLRLARASGRPVVVGPMFDTWADPGGGRDIISSTVARSGPGHASFPRFRRVRSSCGRGSTRRVCSSGPYRPWRGRCAKAAPTVFAASRPMPTPGRACVTKPTGCGRRPCSPGVGSTSRFAIRPRLRAPKAVRSEMSRPNAACTRSMFSWISQPRTDSRPRSRPRWPMPTTTASPRSCGSPE